VQATGARALLAQADVADDAAVRAMVANIVAAFGRIDILVNNAAVTKFAAFEDLEALVADDWTRMFDTNVRGMFQVTRAVAPIMKSLGEGRVVNLSSVSGLRPIGSSIAYSVSKAAVNHLTMCLARTLGPEISVNAIAPGTIVGTRWHDNPRADSFPRPANPGQLNPREVGKGRPATPDDIAGVIASLVTGTDWITGAIILADGARGFT
jgi:NAD(P)-dependent dehydrogenase (short-subunit alcohol dehydrogenase family)